MLDNGVTLQQPSSVMELKESSEAGCHLCTELLEALLPEKAFIALEQTSIPESTFRIHMLRAFEGWVLQIRQIRYGSQELDGVKDLCINPVYRFMDDTSQRIWNLFPHPAWPLARIKAVQPLSGTNINPQAIQQMKQWLHTCTEKHTDCGGPRGLKLLPPNSAFCLVDIKTYINDNIRIVDVCGGPDADDLQYITLSYRWTDEIEQTNLKTENKHEFQRSIPTHAWPKVYRDAVSIAHQLGVRYLWIDSLCIIQDHKEDWIEQSVLMEKIYSGGLLNLAAVEVSGLEVSRNPLRVAPCLLTLNTPGPDSCATNWLCYRPDDIKKAVDRSPLYKRGWCFQERVLSGRSVNFGDQLFWECTTLRASETFPLGTDLFARSEFIDAGIHETKVALQTKNGPQTESFHRRWCSVVRCYTGTELTKPSDRLIALNSIASDMARQFHLSLTDYLAGLWKPSIAFQLLWGRESETYSEADERLASQLANHFPSWSWASCPGEARFTELYTSLSRSFIRLDWAQAWEDAERAPDVSLLVLRGWLVRCELVEYSLAGHNRYRNISFAISIGSGSSISSAAPIVGIEIELDRPVSDLRLEVYLLPVLLRLGPATGLVLARTDRGRLGMVAYRRLGLFDCGDGTKLMDMLVPESRDGSVDNLEEVYDKLSPFILL
jgi:hypothetical protein